MQRKPPFLGSLFGGAASSPWAAGGNYVPGQGDCVRADFAQCFQGCAPPSNCGWAVTPPGGVIFNGSVALVGGLAGGTGYATQSPKTFPPGNLTLQYTFREVPGNPATKAYAGAVFDALGFGVLVVVLFPGTVSVSIGGSTPSDYSGVWTSSPGSVRKVHAYIQGGVPYLFIDGVAIPLTLIGSSGTSFVPSSVAIAAVNSDLDGSAEYQSVFVAQGAYPPTTRFCCP